MISFNTSPNAVKVSLSILKFFALRSTKYVPIDPKKRDEWVRKKEIAHTREQYTDWLKSKSTKALQDLKKDNGFIANIAGFIIDEILQERKRQSK